jgi:hypothetical protein
MKPDDKREFLRVLASTYALYEKKLTDGVVDLWWAALNGYDLAAVKDALGRHCLNPDSGQFCPKPADVVKMAGGSTLDAAMIAWSKVTKAIASIGGYSTVAFDDPLIHRVIADMGGWIQLCGVLEKDLPYRGKEFENRYRGYRARSEIPEYPKTLYGLHDLHNAPLGYASQPVKMIGEREKVLAVTGPLAALESR